MNNMIRLIIGVLSLSISLTSCEKLDLEKDAPSRIKTNIREILKEEVRKPPAQVWEWKVDGNTYYYITSDCCDQFNYLYDEDCNQVCAPDGGISGGGDGNCPQFNGQIEKTLIWEDDRE